MSTPFQDEIRTCVLAGYNVRAMQPVDCYELCAHITWDKVLREKAGEHTIGAVLPYDAYDRTLTAMSKADLTALRARVDKNR